MVVSVVEMAADAYLTCLTHALTTEKEEVMGLLLGEVSGVAIQKLHVLRVSVYV